MLVRENVNVYVNECDMRLLLSQYPARAQQDRLLSVLINRTAGTGARWKQGNAYNA
ncbi:hypothetical protein JCM14469_00020 [Desulfatiferula olefinivorans]